MSGVELQKAHKATYTAKCPVCDKEFPNESWVSTIADYLAHCKETENEVDTSPWGNHFRTLVDVKIHWYDETYETWEDTISEAHLGEGSTSLGVGGPYTSGGIVGV